MAVGTIYMQNSCKQKRSYIPFRTRPFHEMFSLLLLFVSRLFLEMWKYEQKYRFQFWLQTGVEIATSIK